MEKEKERERERSTLRVAASVYNALNRGNANCNLQVSYFVTGHLFPSSSCVSLHHQHVRGFMQISHILLSTHIYVATHMRILKHNSGHTLKRLYLKDYSLKRLLYYYQIKIALHFRNLP